MKNLLIILIVLIAAQTGFGQVIKGEVFDRKENTELVGAIIKLEGTDKGVFTDDNGNFIIDSIPTGTYSLTASFVGYGSTTIANINVIEDSTLTFKIILPSPCEYENSKNNKTCPICKKQDKVVPITYGFLIGKQDKKKFYHAGCEISSCDPNWFCRRDKHKF